MHNRRAVVVRLGVLFVVTAWAEHAWPWGDLGHKVVCEMALRELNDKARKEVIIRLIKNEGDGILHHRGDKCVYETGNETYDAGETEMLPNLKKRRILDKPERGILNPRTAGSKIPPATLSYRTTPWVPTQAFWTTVLGAPQGLHRSRPRLDTRQVAGHVFDVNQIPAFSEVHRQRSLWCGR